MAAAPTAEPVPTTECRQIGPMDLTVYHRSGGDVFEVGRWSDDEGGRTHVATFNAEEFAAVIELGTRALFG